MPRRMRRTLQGGVFHVMNRAVRRTIMFETPQDYEAFVGIVCESLRKFPIKVTAYCLMPNHWHFLVMCERFDDLSGWMHWLEGTHANRWNGAHGLRGSGALYHGRFKAVPVQKDRSFLRVCRYVERNALRKNLVPQAEFWAWSSLYATCNNCHTIPLESWPILRPVDWVNQVNAPETDAELADLRRTLRRNQPVGDPQWQAAVAPFAGLSMRAVGRPRKGPVALTGN